jgi:hypothetical protein
VIAKTQKKLREAWFFLRMLRERDRVAPLEREAFEFYLSAFLSAARSVTFALENEETTKYKEWRATWQTLLTAEEVKFIEAMVEQRNIAQKQGGVPVTVDWEFVPMIKAKRDDRGQPMYGLQWFGPVTAPMPQIGQPVYSIALGTGDVEAIATCERYLSVLERLVAHFLEKYASGSAA